MTSVIKKLGSSLYLKLPEYITVEYSLKDGSPVGIEEKEGKIIITPQKRSLNELLDKINDNNLHGKICYDEPVGKKY